MTVGVFVAGTLVGVDVGGPVGASSDERPSKASWLLGLPAVPSTAGPDGGGIATSVAAVSAAHAAAGARPMNTIPERTAKSARFTDTGR